jgi:ribosomal protein L23
MVEEAIKEFYKVEVEEVRIINIPAKKKKIPRIPTRFGWKKGYKKAIVKLKPQHKIEF